MLKVVHIAANALVFAVPLLPGLGFFMANQFTRVLADELTSGEATRGDDPSPLSLDLDDLQTALVFAEKLFSNFFKFFRLKKLKYIINTTIPD